MRNYNNNWKNYSNHLVRKLIKISSFLLKVEYLNIVRLTEWYFSFCIAKEIKTLKDEKAALLKKLEDIEHLWKELEKENNRLK